MEAVASSERLTSKPAPWFGRTSERAFRGNASKPERLVRGLQSDPSRRAMGLDAARPERYPVYNTHASPPRVAFGLRQVRYR